MIWIQVLIIMLFSSGSDPVMDTSMLTVSISDLQSHDGQIGISVYRSPEGWPDLWEKSVKSMLVEIDSIPLEVQIFDLPEGQYAVSVIHDENKNGVLDKNFMSIPKEGYGVSNNAEAGIFGPPKFADALFELEGTQTVVKIAIQY